MSAAQRTAWRAAQHSAANAAVDCPALPRLLCLQRSSGGSLSASALPPPLHQPPRRALALPPPASPAPPLQPPLPLPCSVREDQGQELVEVRPPEELKLPLFFHLQWLVNALPGVIVQVGGRARGRGSTRSAACRGSAGSLGGVGGVSAHGLG